MRNFRTYGVVLAGALAIGVVGAAVAHETTIRSTVTVDGSRPGPTQRSVTFFGEVKSLNDKCVKRREVLLFDVRTLASKVGETEANADGDWEISVPKGRLRGTQYVQIRKKRLVKTARHRHRCKGDKTQIN
jgi:hypothetical protein